MMMMKEEPEMDRYEMSMEQRLIDGINNSTLPGQFAGTEALVQFFKYLN